MAAAPRDDSLAAYRLALRDLLSYRFDRSRYEDRLAVLLTGMTALGLFSIAITLTFGGGSFVARLLCVPEVAIYLALTWLLVKDFSRRVGETPLWRR